MFRLSHVPPEEATGAIARAYGMFPEGVPVPKPLIMYSASPGMMDAMSGIIQYYMGHKTLSFPLQALIRYLVSCHANYSWCEQFNGALLKQAGMTDDDLSAVQKDPGLAPIEDNEKAMLSFVLKVIKEPESVTRHDIEDLKAQGWQDPDILDAAQLGANMTANRIMNTAFIE
jgi:hypothetical protein